MKMSHQFDYRILPTNEAGETNFLVHLQAPESPNFKRKPLNLGIVIDRSGSMNGRKLDQTREAIKQLIQQLGPKDRISLVTFHSKVETIFTPRFVTDKQTLYDAVDQIRPGGMTNLSGGWLQGIEHVKAHVEEDAIHRVLLMTDGLANRGICEPAQLATIGRDAFEQHHIVTTTLGFGQGFNEDLLERVAEVSGGNFYFIENADMVAEVFREELGDLLKLVAQNIEVTLRCHQDVQLTSQWTTFPENIAASSIHYHMGDAYAGQSKNLLVKLDVPAQKLAGQLDIADVSLRYVEVKEDGTEHCTSTQPVTLLYTDDATEVQTTPDTSVTRELGIQIASRARQEAIDLADQRRFEEARDALYRAAETLSELNPSDPTLMNEIKNLHKQAAKIIRREHYRRERKNLKQEVHFAGKGNLVKLMMMREREEKWGEE